MQNNYDEYGEILLSSASFDVAKWNQLSEYKKAASKVTSFQVFGLIFSLLLMLGLFGYSVYLYSTVKRIHSLKNHYPTYPSGSKVVRGQSGITMNRSGTWGASVYA